MATRIQIDQERYMEAVRKTAQIVAREAVIKFMKAAIRRTSVDSGMTRGAFIRLGELLQVPVPITPKPGHNRTYYGKSGLLRLPKTPRTGAALSTQYASIQDIVIIEGNRVRFRFNSDIFQYFLQEFGLGTPATQVPPPWKSLEEGAKAFNEYMEANLKKRMPDINKFILRS